MAFICDKEDSCEKLKTIKDELNSYQMCVENSLQQVSSLNIKYEHTVNELSTIINIFEYINLVTDYNNLFSIINDMLIGVLGATNSTIFVFENDRYEIGTSNIPRKELKRMEDIGDRLLVKHSKTRTTTIFDEYEIDDEFSAERGIKSAVVVPLNGKDRQIGIIYLEHIKEKYFNDDSVRYLNTLAIAVRLSLENAQLYAKLEEMAFLDGLTGLYNRLYFNKEFHNAMENYKKFGLPFILSMIDVDHFKPVNDTYGHLCGDAVLKDVSDIIKMCIRKDDIVCRFGGEEFAIIFRNTADMKGMMTRLEHLREKIEQNTTLYQNKGVSVTCSMGVVSSTGFDRDGKLEEMLRKADDALYEAKKTGRNRICIAEK